MKNRLKRAFTITELVIVIAVIAVLAAVLIPTFASVIKESKKSHDTQYMKEINVAIADYTALHGQAPQDYDELMLVLADAGLCDTNNPFLLATALKQENMLLVWYPGTDKVRLIDTSTETPLFSSDRGFGNYVLLSDTSSSVMESTGCYILCNRGHKDSMAAAEVYRQLYVLAGGSINSFLAGGHSLADLVKDMENKSWKNSILAAFTNASKGYTYDQNTAQSILDSFKTTNSAQVDLTESLTTEDQQKLQSGTFNDLSEMGKAAIEQGVRGTLATLASLENDSKTKENLANKKVTLEVPEGTVVDMSEVTLTPIGHSYRKEEDVKTGTPQSTVSVDYGNVTLENMEVKEDTFTSTGAELQSESDSGHPGGGYAFTYGLFGTVIAAPGQTVTIENLKLKNVRMNFKGATENINGQTVNTFADNAGIIIGYAQGNVTLRNIEIDGSDEKGTRGLISGYDAIAGVVGRAYGTKKDGKNESATLLIEGVTVKNMDIEGERRASGFVGFISNAMNNVTIKDSKLENVKITCKRNDQGNSIYQCWAMAFVHGSGSNIQITDNTLTNVVTGVDYFGSFLDGIEANDTDPTHNAANGGTSNTWHAISLSKYAYAKNNPARDIFTDTQTDAYKYLLLICDNSAIMKGNKVVVDDGSNKATYNIPDSVDDVKTTAGEVLTLQLQQV